MRENQPCEYYRFVACQKHSDPTQIVQLSAHTVLLDCSKPPRDKVIYDRDGYATHVVLWGKNLNHLRRDAQQILCTATPTAMTARMARSQPPLVPQLLFSAV